MKRFFKVLSTTVVAATLLVSAAGCNFINSILDGLNSGGHTHNLVKQAAVEATCTQEGTKEYYVCQDEDCGQMFSDLNGEHRIYGPEIVEKKAHTLVKTVAKESTCMVEGYKEYYTCSSCRKMFSDADAKTEIAAPEGTGLAAHTLVKVEEKAATETTAGNKAYWTCSTCKKLFADAEGKTETTLSEVYIAPTQALNWKGMAGVSDYVAPTYENGVTTFNTLNNSAYIENVFVDENGNSLVGAYDEANANTEYTYSMNIKASGTFHLILFANETTIPVFATKDLSGSPKYGFYIRFDATDAETNVKIQAALGNSTPEQGIKAKGNSTFAFDGTTENNVRLVLERYSADKAILHIWVNGEEITFTKTSTGGQDKIGFQLRTAWDRNDLVNGIGESYTAKDAAFPTISCSRGLSETEGFGAGLGVAVTGTVTDNAVSGEGQAPVVLSNLSATKTGAQVTHEHTLTKVEEVPATCTEAGWEAYYECSCGKLYSDAEGTIEITEKVIIPARHTLTLVEETASTCIEAGHEAYYECAACGKLFSDAEGANEISAPVAKELAKHTLTKTERVEPTEDTDGNEAYWTCSVCGKLFADEEGTIETTLEGVKLPALGHTHTMTYVEAKAPTCTEDGNVAYYTCSGCGKNFEDENGETEIVNVAIKAAHTLTYIEAAEATALKDGNIAYWYCTVCEGCYADAEATQELSAEELKTTAWNSLKDVTEGTAVVADGTTATFNGLSGSSYVDNVFVEGVAGAYDAAVANTQYTLTAKFKTTGNFGFILFANDITTTAISASNVTDNVMDKLGFYISFEPATESDNNNVKLKAGVGNSYTGKWSYGNKAKAFSSTLCLDGTQENTLQVTVERYSEDKLILQIRVNGELLSFKLTSKYADLCGFTLRTAWDRTDVINGIGEEYTATSNAYPTISVFRGLSAEAGLGCGFGLTVADGATVTLSELSCAKTKDQAVHTHAPTLVEGKAATCTEAGWEAYYECVCGKLYSDAEGTNEIAEKVIIPARHTLTLVEETASTCIEAGHEAYYECGVCGKLFSDAEGANEISAPVAKELAKHTLTKTERVDPTEDTDGNEAYWTCSVCGKLFADEEGTIETTLEGVKLPALGHTHTMTYVEAKAPTCTEDGNVAYYTCSGCGKNFEDENGETEIVDVAIAAAHELTYTAPVAATAFTSGSVEYWYCSVCEKYFKESYAETVLTAEELVVPAWTWNSLKDVENGAPVVADGQGTFTGVESGSYVANVFEDGVAGAYDSAVANTQYTLTVRFKTTGKFILTLFAGEETTSDYTSANITDNVADRLGAMIVFEPTSDTDNNNVKFKTAVGNGISGKAAKTGVKAKTLASKLSFDGVTENVVKITVERYSADTLILQVKVNDELLSFKKTSSDGADICGFHLKTVWDRTDLVNGVGEKGYTSTSTAYPTLGIVRGLSAEEGLGDGVAVAATAGVTVVVSELSVAKTGDQVVAAE